MRPKLKSKADQSSDWRRPSSDNNNIVISSNTASTPVDSTNTMLSIHNTLSNNFKVIDKQILHLYNVRLFILYYFPLFKFLNSCSLLNLQTPLGQLGRL